MALSPTELAADWIGNAEGLLITAGAGMGVDSGLPDFRGKEGFWNAYPALRAEGLSFAEAASPHTFYSDPLRAWGFYGHRLAMYRSTVPHEGFQILRKWEKICPAGAFVYTSNVDGAFQKAGFPPSRVAECHGSIHTMQCLGTCTGRTWSTHGFSPEVDDATTRLRNPLPRCPTCGGLARPNILMFDDGNWLGRQYECAVEQARAWTQDVDKLVIIEIGAGRTIPTVRRFGERSGGLFIRINPDDSKVSRERAIGLHGGALDVLRQIDRVIGTG
ncbi:SIR2 family NAD-dependent protein deacylase [Paraburkholderia sp. ZP32-5]|uniref:SIR2 family NAD-dependent protein deacylase n=1 Tax=Paraburkholderia sp. ZP32-5 TaxID=2883245 RepID=UPI001F163003|nr:Sir2 family NAD-dependent protein deacetylase [Paraburkholderia sp. ZP32-5]